MNKPDLFETFLYWLHRYEESAIHLFLEAQKEKPDNKELASAALAMQQAIENSDQVLFNPNVETALRAIEKGEESGPKN